ncbi:MAG TPA: hypothetical protein VGE74_24725 [Gemmata sp.]
MSENNLIGNPHYGYQQQVGQREGGVGSTPDANPFTYPALPALGFSYHYSVEWDTNEFRESDTADAE